MNRIWCILSYWYQPFNNFVWFLGFLKNKMELFMLENWISWPLYFVSVCLPAILKWSYGGNMYSADRNITIAFVSSCLRVWSKIAIFFIIQKYSKSGPKKEKFWNPLECNFEAPLESKIWNAILNPHWNPKYEIQFWPSSK